MCGIIGVLANQPIANKLIEGLKRLEYRGYDSAGIATIGNDGTLYCRKAIGKIQALENVLTTDPIDGKVGIGHTRWATHGKVTLENCHPHITDYVAVVHNGIIENYHDLKNQLIESGIDFTSDTDTEVISHLITREIKNNKSPEEAVNNTIKQLKGSYSIVVLFSGINRLIIGSCQGASLVLGYGKNEIYIASDNIALAPFTDQIGYLKDGDTAILQNDIAIAKLK